MKPKRAQALKRMQDLLDEAMQKIQKEFRGDPENAFLLTGLLLSLAAGVACVFVTEREFISCANAIWLKTEKQIEARRLR